MIGTWFPSYYAVREGVPIEDWPAMLKMLQNVKELKQTHAEYQAMDGKRKLGLKFSAGGYDCGECPSEINPKTGKAALVRYKGAPAPSQYGMISIDADGPKDEQGKSKGVADGFEEKVKDLLKDYEFFMHSTCTSTDTVHKRRIVIPLAENVTPDVKEALVRYLAQKIGMQDIDPATVHGKQMMTLRVHLSDGELYEYHNVNDFLNAKDWLNKNAPGWISVKNWPQWESDKAAVKKVCAGTMKRIRVAKIKNPNLDAEKDWIPVDSKNKIHNAFNHCFRIEDVLSGSGKYERTSERWSHTYDDSKDGIAVSYSGELYSYYGHDPLSVGRPLDAFETQLILTFGDIDNKDHWAQMYAYFSKNERILEYLKKQSPLDLPADAVTWNLEFDLSEEGIAKRCLRFFPHVRCNGRWYRYSGGLFHESNDSAMLPDVMDMLRSVSLLEPENDALARMVGTNTAGKNILAQWTALAERQAVPNDYFECHGNLLHFTDCVIDLDKLSTGDFILPHSPEYRMTLTTGFAWADMLNDDVKEKMEFVKESLEKFLPNEDTRDYFKMALGRVLNSKASREDICVWLLGPGGDGKSSILNGIKGALGAYAYDLKAQVLYKNKNDNNGEAPSPFLAGMKDKRLVHFEEFSRIRTLNAENYKTFTSSGEMKARKMRENDNSFKAKCCCVIDCNGMPNVDVMDDAIIRRTKIIPFKTKLANNAMIKGLWQDDKAVHKACFWLMLEGYKMWAENGYSLPQAPPEVEAETNSWIQSFDRPESFFNDYLEITGDESSYIINQEVYSEYRNQAIGKCLAEHSFLMALDQWLRQNGLGEKRKRSIGGNVRRLCYVGVRLLQTTDGAMVTTGQWSYRKNINVYKAG